MIGEGSDTKRFLYVGTPDNKGEYPVISLAADDGCWVGGFVPFDVWVAQQLVALDPEEQHGSVPQEYEVFCRALAATNGDGRVGFKSETRAVERDGDGEEAGDADDTDDLDELDGLDGK